MGQAAGSVIRLGVSAAVLSARKPPSTRAAPQVTDPGCPHCAALQAEVAGLQAQVAELQARLSRNSSNSSRPPSSDPPSARKRNPPRQPSGRKPGGQRGHPGRTRELKPLDALTGSFDYLPSACEHCRSPLSGEQVCEDLPPLRHQVTELARVLVETFEYRLHARRCSCCQQVTRARLPEGVSDCVAGPRLQAFCALLTGRFRLSRRSAQELVACALGEALSLGTLCALEARTAAALSGPYEEIAAAVRAATAVNTDETPWKSGKQRLTLWLAATPTLAFFRIDPHRSRDAFEALLPPGSHRTVTSDRYSVYTHLTGDAWQICWAHLLRDFQALADRKDDARAIGEAAKREIRQLFGLWHGMRAGQFDRRTLRARLRPVQARFKTLLRRAARQDHPAAGGLARSLLRHWASLWTFARVEGVEPTNNHAERTLRPAVLWRKSSFGHQSEGGKEFVERLLSVVGSLRLQGRDVLAYLEAACRGGRHATAVPALVPSAPPAASSLAAC